MSLNESIEVIPEESLPDGSSVTGNGSDGEEARPEPPAPREESKYMEGGESAAKSLPDSLSGDGSSFHEHEYVAVPVQIAEAWDEPITVTDQEAWVETVEIVDREAWVETVTVVDQEAWEEWVECESQEIIVCRCGAAFRPQDDGVDGSLAWHAHQREWDEYFLREFGCTWENISDACWEAMSAHGGYSIQMEYLPNKYGEMENRFYEHEAVTHTEYITHDAEVHTEQILHEAITHTEIIHHEAEYRTQWRCRVCGALQEKEE
ncbi:MAG: hypothetical protein IJM90_09790 [Firmicutes bacterium]|nr:hypothetical protein [Bacillota bacterium]